MLPTAGAVAAGVVAGWVAAERRGRLAVAVGALAAAVFAAEAALLAGVGAAVALGAGAASGALARLLLAELA